MAGGFYGWISDMIAVMDKMPSLINSLWPSDTL